jgi:hypothetical protein
MFSLRLCSSVFDLRCPFVAHILEPIRAAVLAVQPSLSVGEAALGAAFALGRVGAVEERNMLVADILEPGNC